MERVVVTGLGLVSSIGNSKEDAASALREGRSGLTALPEMREAGMTCCVYGAVKECDGDRIPRRWRRTMGPLAQFAGTAVLDAMADAGLNPAALDVARSGVLVGNVFGGVGELSRMHRLLAARKKSRAGTACLMKTLNSTASGNLASLLGFKGRAYSVSTSFASGADNVGHAYELIKHGVMDVAVCGAAEEDCWVQIGPYLENLGALPTRYRGDPAEACRPFDVDRQGAVLSAGAGILVLESLEHARRRHATVYAEMVGYGSTNDGVDMFCPTGEGLRRAMRSALDGAEKHGVRSIDYVNAQAAGTLVGDQVEVAALRDVVGEGPLVSSTKGLTGHAMGAAGALQLVYTLLMMSQGFVAATANLRTVAAECAGVNHVREMIERAVTTAMSVSVGFGGFNSSVVLSRMDKA